mmetsp:Transcript_63300/g.147428  ORF Transcript_63300/g.147428 Transcript_63300/m.147428 type:complete len:150 (+) Transcript_63300:204-653(+)
MSTSVLVMGASQFASQQLASGRVHDRRGVAIWTLWGLILGFMNDQWQALIARYGPKQLALKLAVDHALWKVPVLYTFVAYDRLCRGATPGHAWKQSIVAGSALQWKALQVFPIIQILNFTVVPLQLRVLYMNVTLFGWCIYLALKMRMQ